MANKNDDDRDHIPEDDDPAYHTPYGKLPDKPQSDGSAPAERAKQPFDFETTVMHTEAERRQYQLELAARHDAEMRTAEVKSALKWLESFRKGYDRNMAYVDRSPKDPSKRDVAQRAADMYNDCSCIWGDEIGMFIKELRQELADWVEQQYPDTCKSLAADLRSGEYPF